MAPTRVRGRGTRAAHRDTGAPTVPGQERPRGEDGRVRGCRACSWTWTRPDPSHGPSSRWTCPTGGHPWSASRGSAARASRPWRRSCTSTSPGPRSCPATSSCAAAHPPGARRTGAQWTATGSRARSLSRPDGARWTATRCGTTTPARRGRGCPWLGPRLSSSRGSGSTCPSWWGCSTCACGSTSTWTRRRPGACGATSTSTATRRPTSGPVSGGPTTLTSSSGTAPTASRTSCTRRRSGAGRDRAAHSVGEVLLGVGDRVTDHRIGHARGVALAREHPGEAPGLHLDAEAVHAAQLLVDELAGPGPLGAFVDAVQGVGGDLGVDALGAQLLGECPPGKAPLGLLRPDQHLGVGHVVDEPDFGHAVEHRGGHVVGAVALTQLVLELLPAARRHRELAQDDLARHVVRVGLGVAGLQVLLGVARLPPAARPRAVRASRRCRGPIARGPLARGRRGQGSFERCPGRVVLVAHGPQKSTGTSATGSAGLSTCGPTPSFSLIFFSSSSARSGLSRRKVRAFSLPWPSWSPS